MVLYGSPAAAGCGRTRLRRFAIAAADPRPACVKLGMGVATMGATKHMTRSSIDADGRHRLIKIWIYVIIL